MFGRALKILILEELIIRRIASLWT